MCSNPRYTCPFCPSTTAEVLLRNLFKHLHKNHNSLFWTEKNKNRVEVSAKKPCSWVLMLEVKTATKVDELYFSPRSERLYRKKAQADNDLRGRADKYGKRETALAPFDHRTKLMALIGVKEALGDCAALTAVREELEAMKTALVAAQKKEEMQGKKIELLEKMMEKDAQMVQRAEETKSALSTVLECLDNRNRGEFKYAMVELKNRHLQVWKEQLEQLDIGEEYLE